MSANLTNVAVIGAGMAGLTFASEITRRGHKVTVFDKGRGPGGRMACRRAQVAGRTVSFDHGAQYFTARDPRFEQAVDAWEKDGIVARWPAAGGEAFVGIPGMNGPLRALSKEIDVDWESRVSSLSFEDGQWRLTIDETDRCFETVVLAVPAEQACELLEPVGHEFSQEVAQASSAPCWAVMAAFPAPLPVARDVFRSQDGPISWAARNSAKPDRQGMEAWVIHASPARSEALLELAPEVAARIVMTDFFTVLGLQPVAPLHLVAHRWRFSLPSTLDGPAARWDAEKRIGLAGDYLHSPRVEGAWLSGFALAEMISG